MYRLHKFSFYALFGECTQRHCRGIEDAGKHQLLKPPTPPWRDRGKDLKSMDAPLAQSVYFFVVDETRRRFPDPSRCARVVVLIKKLCN